MAWMIRLSREAEAALCKLDKPIRQRATICTGYTNWIVEWDEPLYNEMTWIDTTIPSSAMKEGA